MARACASPPANSPSLNGRLCLTLPFFLYLLLVLYILYFYLIKKKKKKKKKKKTTANRPRERRGARQWSGSCSHSNHPYGMELGTGEGTLNKAHQHTHLCYNHNITQTIPVGGRDGVERAFRDGQAEAQPGGPAGQAHGSAAGPGGGQVSKELALY